MPATAVGAGPPAVGGVCPGVGAVVGPGAGAGVTGAGVTDPAGAAAAGAVRGAAAGAAEAEGAAAGVAGVLDGVGPWAIAGSAKSQAAAKVAASVFLKNRIETNPIVLGKHAEQATAQLYWPTRRSVYEPRARGCNQGAPL